jgi:hypothetical protein
MDQAGLRTGWPRVVELLHGQDRPYRFGHRRHAAPLQRHPQCGPHCSMQGLRKQHEKGKGQKVQMWCIMLWRKRAFCRALAFTNGCCSILTFTLSWWLWVSTLADLWIVMLDCRSRYVTMRSEGLVTGGGFSMEETPGIFPPALLHKTGPHSPNCW